MGVQRMDFDTLVQTRKSVRGVTREPVFRAVIEEIIEEHNGDFVRYVGFAD